MMDAKILLVEDEKKIARFMELELMHEGYEVEVVKDGQSGLKKVKEENYNLVLLDIMLPKMDGMEVCSRIREFSDIPIIMVTAKDSTPSKVEGLDLGADDYITKPFEIEELLARIRALMRRKKPDDKEGILKVDDLVLDTNKHQVKRAGNKIELTKKEYDLLEYLLRNEEVVISREQLLREIWGYDYTGETNIVDVYIRYLRSKIDDPFTQKLIHTVRGVGYVLREEEK
ncbi:MAG: response regulator transcription factor [Halanaerobiales bacterium]